MLAWRAQAQEERLERGRARAVASEKANQEKSEFSKVQKAKGSKENMNEHKKLMKEKICLEAAIEGLWA